MGGRTALGFDGKLLLAPAFEASVGESLSILAPGGKEVEAKVAGFDPGLALAVLELSQPLPDSAWTAAQGLPALGALLLVAAYPSPEGPEVRLDALRFAGGKGEDEYLQTDGAPFPGFSGAALVDPEGSLAGFLLADRGGNRGWALPASRAASLVGAIVAGRTSSPAWLGISTVPIEAPPEMASAFGDDRSSALLVSGVEPGSPASTADLRVGDILVSLGDKMVAEPADLAAALASARVGADLAIVILRSGERKELVAVPTARSSSRAEHYGRPGHGHGPWWMGGDRCGWKPGR
jgi:S1-C subfamily serine protease